MMAPADQVDMADDATMMQEFLNFDGLPDSQSPFGTDEYSPQAFAHDSPDGLPDAFQSHSSPSNAFDIVQSIPSPNSSGDSRSSSSSKAGKRTSSGGTSYDNFEFNDVKTEWSNCVTPSDLAKPPSGENAASYGDTLGAFSPNDAGFLMNPNPFEVADVGLSKSKSKRKSKATAASIMGTHGLPSAVTPPETGPFNFANGMEFPLFPSSQPLNPHGRLVNLTPDMSPQNGVVQQLPVHGYNTPYMFNAPPQGTMSPNAWGQAMSNGNPQFPLSGAIPAQMPPLPPYYSQPRPPRLNLKPLDITKSRVETQIAICFCITDLPDQIKRLHIPTHTISKPKLLSRPPVAPADDMYELHTVLVCSSAMIKPEVQRETLKRAARVAQKGRRHEISPEDDEFEGLATQDGGEVRICSGCMTREKKRFDRKTKKFDNDDDWLGYGTQRAIVFNIAEVKEWTIPQHDDEVQMAGGSLVHQVKAPMRIACYCRHHAEKEGFHVIFTLTDHKFNFIDQIMSPRIMITDDHKASTATHPDPVAMESSTAHPQVRMPDVNGLTPPAASHSMSPSGPFPVTPAGQSQSGITIPTPRTLSRPASPNSLAGPHAKKRKASGKTSISRASGLVMTPLQTTAQSSAPSAPPATSPFAASPTGFSATPDRMLYAEAGADALNNMHAMFPSALSAGLDQSLQGNFGSTAPPQFDVSMFSAPGSAQQSRAASPHGLSMPTSPSEQQMSTQLAHASLGGLSAPPQARATIQKVVPGEGPKSGGYEVTVLGNNFRHGDVVLFGDAEAVSTQHWADNTLVCKVPPSSQDRIVPVTIRGQPTPIGLEVRTFRYIDHDKELLLRMFISCATGLSNDHFQQFQEFQQFMTSRGGGNNGNSGNSGSNPHNTGNTMFATFLQQYNNRDSKIFETLLLKLLGTASSNTRARKLPLNSRGGAGQTMLHFACSLGLQQFVSELVARGADVDMRDNGGYTPLHFAVLNNRPEIVRRLLSGGADPTLRTLSGLLPADVARSEDVLQALRCTKRHVSSPSRVSLRSAASSAASLQSLVAPVHRASSQVFASRAGTDEESLEYSSFADSEGDSDSTGGDEQWLDMRRKSSTRKIPALEADQDGSQRPANGPAGGFGSPTAAVVAFRDQFTTQLQQLQQTMLLSLQNFPQLRQFSQGPYLPQMPYMPVLPDQAAVLQRLMAMMPAIGALRPAQAGDQLPPSYDEIFPRHPHDSAMDKKQASAAQAALEAEGDAKCAVLFDSQVNDAKVGSSSLAPVVNDNVESGSSSLEQAVDDDTDVSSDRSLPELLEIGRKNAITKKQQENLRRAHAAKFKSQDPNLFFIWIPLLLVALVLLLYGHIPVLLALAKERALPILRNAQEELQQLARTGVIQPNQAPQMAGAP